MRRPVLRHERLGVGALMVVGRERIGHQDRRLAERGELGDRRRAGAADDEIGARGTPPPMSSMNARTSAAMPSSA